MTVSFNRLLLATLLAVLAGLAAVWGLRTVDGERQVFYGVARAFNNGPLFGTGDGSRARPWSLRVKAPVSAIDHGKAPVVVSLGDDPMGLFQTRPPSPVDIAAVLRYLRNAGGGNAAIAAVFEWPEANALAYQGLESVMDEFGMTIQAAPLKRGTVVDDMPEPFQRAALLPDAVKGDPRGLPLVNGLAMKNIFFGGRKTLAGFSTLDDVGLADRVPLLARWQDDKQGRVVLAFPLLAVLARHDLPLTGLRVRLGETLELGPDGPMVPIDSNGCMLLPPWPVEARVDVAAADLVMADPGFFPKDAGLVVLRDDQSASDEATKRFSAGLASVMAAIESDGGLAAARVYPRFAAVWEWGMAAVLLVGAWLGARMRPFGRNVWMGCLLAAVVAAQWLGFGMAGMWLPGVGLACGLVVFWWLVAATAAARTPQQPALVGAPAGVGDPTALKGTTLRTVTIWRESSGVRQTAAVADAGQGWPDAALELVAPEVPPEYMFPPREEPATEPGAATVEDEPRPEESQTPAASGPDEGAGIPPQDEPTPVGRGRRTSPRKTPTAKKTASRKSTTGRKKPETKLASAPDPTSSAD